MAILNFTLSPECCARIHDALTCLSKFSENVTIEARKTQLSFTTLNSSKSAYASIALDQETFFTNYNFVPDRDARDQTFSCSIQNKALISVFRGKFIDTRGGDSAVDRCDVNLEDHEDRAACRLHIKMYCRHGVTKHYRFTYESVDMMHALFDRNRATNRWKIQSRLLREYVEYFGPKTEQLDIFSEEGRVTLTSYTEKITNDKEILKQPLQTAVSVDTQEFEEFTVQENLHVAISVKDFRNIVIHADTLRSSITAMYSQPSRPLQFSYGAFGIRCEFTLMTMNDPRVVVVPTVARVSTREPQTRSVSRAPSNGEQHVIADMPPPQRPIARSSARQTNQLGSRVSDPTNNTSIGPDSNSLFVPQVDEDRQWDPVEYRGDGDEDMLGWDASANNDLSFRGTFRDTDDINQRPSRGARQKTNESGIAPTQKASQVRGLFD